MTIVVRSAMDIAQMAPALREAVRDLDAALPAPDIQDVSANRASASAGPRFNLWLLTAFAAIALVLAVTGVYAMLSFSVAERRREIAVRLALGASSSGITRLVVTNGLGLALAGVAIGTIGAVLTTGAMSSLLYAVEPTDAWTFSLAAALLLGAATCACYLPARQAGRLDPVSLLRE